MSLSAVTRSRGAISCARIQPRRRQHQPKVGAGVRTASLPAHMIIGAMAETLVAAFEREGNAGESDLYLAGFDPDAISRHALAARRRALSTLAARGLDVWGV